MCTKTAWFGTVCKIACGETNDGSLPEFVCSKELALAEALYSHKASRTTCMTCTRWKDPQPDLLHHATQCLSQDLDFFKKRSY